MFQSSKSRNIKVSGDHNTVAFGNISIHQGKLPADIKRMFSSKDRLVQKALGKLSSPKAHGHAVNYSSQKLYESLSILGIPADIAIAVVEKAPEAIIRAKKNSPESFSTSDVRWAVSELMLSLPLDPDIEARRHEWVARYARKYGNPNQPMIVYHSDGREESLTYRFLMTNLVPTMIRRVVEGKTVTDREIDAVENEESKVEYSVNYNTYFGIIGKSSIGEMAEEIIINIKRLDLYSIRYKTLLNLAEDIALQPPHPWFVNEDTLASTVAYDAERAEFHLSRLNESSIRSTFWQTFGECCHHSASSILAFYGLFLGCGFLAPVKRLRHTLDILNKNQNIALWKLCKVYYMQEDILRSGMDISELSMKLERVILLYHDRRDDSIKSALDLANGLQKISKQLIAERGEFDSAITSLYSGASLSVDRHNSIFVEVISGSDCFKFVKLSEEGLAARVKIIKSSELTNYAKPLPILIDCFVTYVEQVPSIIRNLRHKKLTDSVFLLGIAVGEVDRWVEQIDINIIPNIYLVDKVSYLNFMRDPQKSEFLVRIIETSN